MMMNANGDDDDDNDDDNDDDDDDDDDDDGRVIQYFTVITMAAVSQVPEDDKAINSLCTFISKVRNT